jgi:hypothetical protein
MTTSARHNSAAGRRSTLSRYFFFSIFVMVSPDCVKDT